jgi:hypothetical protein
LFFQRWVFGLKVEEIFYQALINKSRTNPDRGWNIIFCSFTNFLIVFGLKKNSFSCGSSLFVYLLIRRVMRWLYRLCSISLVTN